MVQKNNILLVWVEIIMYQLLLIIVQELQVCFFQKQYALNLDMNGMVLRTDYHGDVDYIGNDYGECFGGHWNEISPRAFTFARHFRSCRWTSNGVCGNYIGMQCGWFPGKHSYGIDGAPGTCTALGSLNGLSFD